jgi:hypothetical protein
MAAGGGIDKHGDGLEARLIGAVGDDRGRRCVLISRIWGRLVGEEGRGAWLGRRGMICGREAVRSRIVAFAGDEEEQRRNHVQVTTAAEFHT